MPPDASAPASSPTPTPAQLLKSRAYVGLLVIGAILGIPVAVVSYAFLRWVGQAQAFLFTDLPANIGFDGTPAWWPTPFLVLCGFLVALIIRLLPGTGGHEPAEGFKASGPVPVNELPGIILAAFVTLSLGAVLGPEAPLIAIGSGMGVLAMRLIKKDAPDQAVVVISAAGSFAAISMLLGSPITGAFLMMEVAGLGGAMMGVILLPGLLAAGIGALMFIGLDSWTGFGTFSIVITGIPSFTTPTVVEFLWAVAIGLICPVLGTIIRRLSLAVQPLVLRNRLWMSPLIGLGVGLIAFVFAVVSGKDVTWVLFSGQDSLPSLIQGAAGWTVGALVLLIACKGLAYALSLGAFRGGPIFPSMFIGAALGIALSHTAGLPMIAGVAMGIGAMTVAMLGLPLTSVLLAVLILASDALALTPLVIVAVVVSYVTSGRLAPAARSEDATADAAAG